MIGRTRGLGTPIGHLEPPPVEKHPIVVYRMTPEQIEQHLAKYPAHKMRLPQKETLFERTIRPQKRAGDDE